MPWNERNSVNTNLVHFTSAALGNLELKKKKLLFSDVLGEMFCEIFIFYTVDEDAIL